MWYCGECGKENDGKYCTRCGTVYVDPEDASAASPTLADAEAGEGLVSSAPDGENEKQAAAAQGQSVTENKTGASPASVEAEEEAASVPGSSPAQAGAEAAADAPTATASDFLISEEASAPDRWELPERAGGPIFPGNVATDICAVGETNAARLFRDLAAEELPSLRVEETGAVPPQVTPTGPAVEGDHELSWDLPFNHTGATDATDATGAPTFLRQNGATAETEAGADGATDIGSIFTHRSSLDTAEDKEFKYYFRALVTVGIVGVVVLGAFIFLVSSLLSTKDTAEALPAATGVYYFVSGGDDAPIPLYAEKSIDSEVLTGLPNGATVEFLVEVNDKFAQVYDSASKQYGFIHSAYLVQEADNVDYGESENRYDEEMSLGYYYVTKTDNVLPLWEKPEGNGVVKARLRNGDKVSLLEQTNNDFWYVFDYISAERGYVKRGNLTASESDVSGNGGEPEDKTIIGDYYITGVKQYLPLWSAPQSDSSVRAQLYNNGKVGVIEKTGGSFWYVFDYNKKVYGWVSTSYLTTEPPPKEAVAQVADTYIVTGTKKYLPLLDAAEPGSNQLGQLHNGDTVTLLEPIDDTYWRVRAGDVEGYVWKEYLTQ